MSVLFKSLNTLVIILDRLVQTESSQPERLKYLALLAELSSAFHNLFQLVCKLVLADDRALDALERYKSAASKHFSQHRCDSVPRHPLLHFAAFAVHHFLEPRVPVLLSDILYKLTSQFDRGGKTPSVVLKLILDAKFGLRKFYSFYLALFPEKRFVFLQNFFEFVEKQVFPSVGLTFTSEVLRAASFTLKSLQVQNYIECYSHLKDDSVQLESRSFIFRNCVHHISSC